MEKILKSTVIFCLVFITACQVQNQDPATTTTATAALETQPATAIIPSDTPPPTPTQTRQPSSTPTTVLQEKESPVLRTMMPGGTQESQEGLIPREIVEEGGYSFKTPAGFMFDIDRNFVDVFNLELTTKITLAGTDAALPKGTPKDFVVDFLNEVFSDKHGRMELSDGKTIIVDGKKGSLYEIGGKLYNKAVKGHLAIFELSKTHFVYAYGYASDINKAEGNPWEEVGQAAFAEVVSSLKFFTPHKSQLGAKCPIAHDPTYGLLVEHPIRVGGGNDSGSEREEIYLGNLLGPNREQTHYFRWGTYTINKEIVDVYTITYPGATYLIFLSKVGWVPPMAPVGFTCKVKFNLSYPY